MGNFIEKLLSVIFQDIRIALVFLIAILTLALFAYRYFKNKENSTNDDIL